MAKDKKTLWTEDLPPQNTRTRDFNTVKEKKGLRSGIPADMTPIALFKLFMPEELIGVVVGYTNSYAESQRPNWQAVTNEELYSFIGILLYLGVEKKK